LDGSPTPAKNGGQAVGYQGRKTCKTTSSLFICDNKGVMLVVGSNHNDLYEIRVLLAETGNFLKAVGVEVDGLFLNADAGFDSAELRNYAPKRVFFLTLSPILGTPVGTPATRISLTKAELLFLTRFFIKKELLLKESTAG
jgi:hypothetical protein